MYAGLPEILKGQMCVNMARIYKDIQDTYFHSGFKLKNTGPCSVQLPDNCRDLLLLPIFCSVHKRRSRKYTTCFSPLLTFNVQMTGVQHGVIQRGA